MTIAQDLVYETLSHLSGMVPGNYNRLASNIDTGDQEEFELEFELGGIVPGSVIGIGSEEILVLETSGQSVTKAVRGFGGSTAGTASGGIVVTVGHRFSTFRILKALRSEIDSWGSRLYKVDGSNISLAASTRGYPLGDLGDNFLHVIKAYAEPDNTYIPDSAAWPETDFRIARNLDTSEFAGGNAIFFNDYLYRGSGRNVRLLYASKFDTSTFTADTDLELDVGLASSMLDIPPLGAAWRLMISQESQRTDTRAQGQSRDATEVPPTAALQTTQALKTMRDSRLAEEQLSLVAKYGFNGGF